MVGLLTMTGGASLVGVWVYRRWGDQKQVRRVRKVEPIWWQTAWQRVQDWVQPASQPVAAPNPPRPGVTRAADQPVATLRPQADHDATIGHGLCTAALALAVTTTGRLLYPPGQVVGLPLLVYMGIPAAQQAYDQLVEEGRPGRALVETGVLVVCLVGGYFWVGSLGFSLYYAGRRLLTEQEQSAVVHPSEWVASPMTHLRKEGAVCAVPTATLQPGDQVILQSGEMAPVDGLITEGVVWLRPHALSSTASGLRKSVGDRVAAMDLVLVGRICARVLPAA